MAPLDRCCLCYSVATQFSSSSLASVCSPLPVWRLFKSTRDRRTSETDARARPPDTRHQRVRLLQCAQVIVAPHCPSSRYSALSNLLIISVILYGGYQNIPSPASICPTFPVVPVTWSPTWFLAQIAIVSSSSHSSVHRPVSALLFD